MNISFRVDFNVRKAVVKILIEKTLIFFLNIQTSLLSSLIKSLIFHATSGQNCAVVYDGGWWYNHCLSANLNGPWGRLTRHATGIIWYDWKGLDEALKESTMKFKCV